MHENTSKKKEDISHTQIKELRKSHIKYKENYTNEALYKMDNL